MQKILSDLGMASRRKAEEMIEEGRVTVNGKTAVLGMKADPDIDHIKVDGKPVKKREAKIYLAFHKPKNVVSTLEDPQERPTVKDYLKKIRFRLYPVGRLDYHSEGLLLLTNDGEFTNMVLHPSRKIPKTYHVKVKGVLEEEEMERFRSGIKLADGMTQPAKIKPIGKTEANSWLEVIITEGKKRQIRRMMESLGHPVMKLQRVQIDGIKLGNLPPGHMRPLTVAEIESIKRAGGREKKEAAKR